MGQPTMKTLRKNTTIIAERAAIFAGYINCNEREKQAAKTAATNAYNQGCSGANSISQGYKTALRWKKTGIARKNNVIQFPQKMQNLRVAGA